VAGLEINRLATLLQRIQVECSSIEGDDSQDRCLLRLASLKRPGLVAFVEYLTQRDGSRLVRIKMEPPEPTEQEDLADVFWITEQSGSLTPLRSVPRSMRVA
jgi:hypothetical protein